MKYRRFGRTGLRVSEIVFGGGRVGGLLLFQDDDTKRAAIRRALAAGVNWIDTAADYGDGESEKAIGWLLEEVTETPYVSTKVRLEIDRLDDIAGQIERSLHDSLTRLRRQSVDLFQLHNPIAPDVGEGAVTVDHVLGDGGAADGLDRMRDQGLTRHIGITALGDAACCRQVIASDRFDSAQVYYNLINPTAGRAVAADWSGQDFGGIIAACRGHDVAVMDIRVLAAGVLATDQRTGRESPVAAGSGIEAEERRAKAMFAALGGDHGTRAQTAVRFALANRDFACVIVGLHELRHLEEALGAAEMGPLPDPALARLDQFYTTEFGGL